MKRLIAFILSILLVLSLAGCSGKTMEQMAGNWKGTIDLSGMIKEEISNSDPELIGFFDLDGLTMDVLLSCSADGNYRMAVDQNEAAALINTVKVRFSAGAEDYLTYVLENAAKEQGMELETILGFYGVSSASEIAEAVLGMTMEEFVEEQFPADEFISSLEMPEDNGTITVKKNNLTFTSTEGGQTAGTYDPKADTVTIDMEGSGLDISQLTFVRK